MTTKLKTEDLPTGRSKPRKLNLLDRLALRRVIKKDLLPKDYLHDAQKVTEIVKDTDSICEALGMSEERATELVEHANSILIKPMSISQKLEKINSICTHANEIAFISFQAGVARSPKNLLGEFLSHFKKD